jgi:hypothetical protein
MQPSGCQSDHYKNEKSLGQLLRPRLPDESQEFIEQESDDQDVKHVVDTYI